jgi:seryl-tRNA synthetase
MYAAGFLPLAKADLYGIEGEDLNLIGTAEHPLCNLHVDEIIEEKDLPIRYCGFSPCFRTEAGSHGRDTKGFFRVHQFNKVEQFVFSTPEQSAKEHELLINNAEEIFKKLGIPHRVVNICTGDLGWVAAKKYDIEAWFPGQGKYREVVSCSNCTDYQARRCNTRCWEHPGAETRFVHTLNATAVAVERCMIAIMENYQQKDGSIEIPKVLRPYMGGQESISKKK